MSHFRNYVPQVPKKATPKVKVQATSGKPPAPKCKVCAKGKNSPVHKDGWCKLPSGGLQSPPANNEGGAKAKPKAKPKVKA